MKISESRQRKKNRDWNNKKQINKLLRAKLKSKFKEKQLKPDQKELRELNKRERRYMVIAPIKAENEYI